MVSAWLSLSTQNTKCDTTSIECSKANAPTTDDDSAKCNDGTIRLWPIDYFNFTNRFASQKIWSRSAHGRFNVRIELDKFNY